MLLFLAPDDTYQQANMRTQVERIANEKHFIQWIKISKQYIWKDTGNIYIIINNRKMKPTTLKGYVELAGIVRRQFMDIFVELPCGLEDLDKNKILNMVADIDK